MILRESGVYSALTGNTHDLRNEWNRAQQNLKSGDHMNLLPTAATAFKMIAPADQLVVSANGRHAASRNGTIVTVTSLENGQVQNAVDLHQNVSLLAVTDDGARLLTTNPDPPFGVQFVKVASGAPTKTTLTGQLIRAVFTGSVAYVLTSTGLMRIAKDGSAVQIQLPSGTPYAITTEPFGARLWGMTTDPNQNAAPFYVDSGAGSAMTIDAPGNLTATLAVARGGRLLYIARNDDVLVTEDDGANPTPLHQLTGSSSQAITHPALAPDASSFLFTSSDINNAQPPHTTISYAGVNFRDDSPIPYVQTNGEIVSGIVTRY